MWWLRTSSHNGLPLSTSVTFVWNEIRYGLEKDEKYTEVNIAILESFRCDAQLSCDPQVCKHA